MKELSGEISSTKNVDGNTTKVIEEAIKGANGVFEKLIGSLDKLSGVTKENTPIADGAHADTSAGGTAAGAHKESVDIIIEEVRAIVETANSSGMNVPAGNPGSAVVDNADGKAGSALIGKNNTGTVPSSAGSGPALADEVAKADPWAMIDKIKNATTKSTGTVLSGHDNEAGALATGFNSSGGDTKAKTNADLAAAVALKAMTKGGKFTHAANESGSVKAAAASALNKVLGVLDEIIRKVVNHQLGKIKDAVKGIQYSETTGEAIEVKK